MKKSHFSAVVVLLMLSGGAPAYAGGFLADTFVRPFSPKLADDLDKKHAEMGNPLDHLANAAAAAAAEVIVPGAGLPVYGVLDRRMASMAY